MPRVRIALLAGCVAVAAVTLALVAPHSPGAVRDLVGGFGAAAPLVFVGAWVLCTPALASGTLLCGASGLLFGAALGSAVSLVGATLGGLLAFALARRFGAGALARTGGPRLARIRERLAERGFWAVLSLRAAPGVPATWLNYAAGLARVRPRAFVAAIAIGGAPRLFAYTALGGNLGHLTSPTAIVAVAVLATMTAVGAFAAWLTGRRLRPGV